MLLQSLSSLIGNYNLYKFICRWMKLKYTIHQEHRYFTHPSYPVFAVVTYQNQLYVQNVFWNVWIFSRRTVFFAVLQESLPTTSLTESQNWRSGSDLVWDHVVLAPSTEKGDHPWQTGLSQTLKNTCLSFFLCFLPWYKGKFSALSWYLFLFLFFFSPIKPNSFSFQNS